MKRLFAVMVSAVLITACSKKNTTETTDPLPEPEMRYTNLSDQSIKFNQQTQIDLNGDNVYDIAFGTLLVGDGMLRRDRRQYYAHSSLYTSYMFNTHDQTPSLQYGEWIRTSNHSGYEWYNANAVLLAEKIVPETGSSFWVGDWVNTHHRFLPVQILHHDRRYNGWIELSFKTSTEEIILHRAAMSTEPERDIKAGK